MNGATWLEFGGVDCGVGHKAKHVYVAGKEQAAFRLGNRVCHQLSMPCAGRFPTNLAGPSFSLELSLRFMGDRAAPLNNLLSPGLPPVV